jgi:hypothetical protein
LKEQKNAQFSGVNALGLLSEQNAGIEPSHWHGAQAQQTAALAWPATPTTGMVSASARTRTDSVNLVARFTGVQTFYLPSTNNAAVAPVSRHTANRN